MFRLRELFGLGCSAIDLAPIPGVPPEVGVLGVLYGVQTHTKCFGLCIFAFAPIKSPL